jgi:hypothetical protein
VKIKDLKPKQLFSVPCPTCGAAVGKPCELISGGQRNEPHPDRKIEAAEALEKNMNQMDA